MGLGKARPYQCPPLWGFVVKPFLIDLDSFPDLGDKLTLPVSALLQTLSVFLVSIPFSAIGIMYRSKDITNQLLSSDLPQSNDFRLSS